MPNARKFLQGELRNVEGKTSVDNFLKDIASELVRKGWVTYKKRGSDAPWAFNENREIHLPESFKKENIKLFKTLAFTETLPSGLSIGKIKVIKGVTSEDHRTLNLILNDLSYVIQFEMGATREQIATEIADTILRIEGFEDTLVEDDGITVTIAGSKPVYSLETDAETEGEAVSEMVTFSETLRGIGTGTIRVLSDAMESGQIEIQVNEDTVTVPVVQGQPPQQVARNIRDRIIAMGKDFSSTVALDGVVTVSGETEVTNLVLDTNDTQITNTMSSVQGGFGTITVLSEARQDGVIQINLNNLERVVAVTRGDTPVIIAQKIQNYISSLTGFTLTNASDNVVTIAGSTTVTALSLDTDVDAPPLIFTDSYTNPALDVGSIEIVTRPLLNQLIQVSVNGMAIPVSISGGDSLTTVAKKIRDAIAMIDMFSSTTYSGNKVRVSGSVEIYSISVTTDLAIDNIYVQSSITTGGQHMGRVEIIQSVGEDVSITITLNDKRHVVQLTSGETPDEIASKIADVLKAIEGYEETTSEDNIVNIKGSQNIEFIDISPIEIPETDFELHDTTIVGVGDRNSGTMIGDNVIIKTIYEGEEFQRLTFLEGISPNGETKVIAKLKSRPKGDIALYKDTILKVENEVLQQRGDSIFYKMGKSPVSESRGDHEVVIKKGATMDTLEIVPKEDYVVDYFNGNVIFKVANAPSDLVVASYGVHTGQIGELIPSSSYRIINDKLIDITEDNSLLNQDIVVRVDYHWELAYPTSLDEVNATTERIILKTKVDVTSIKNKTHRKNYYWELRHSKVNTNKYLTGLECRFGTALDGSGTTLNNNTSSAWARWAWYDQKGFANGLIIDSGTVPIYYDMSFTQEYINIVIQGSPNVDTLERNNFLISYAYLGALEGYEGATNEDIQYNFGMTVGGDEIYEKGQFPKDWGLRTGTGITDIVMEKTGDGTPFQAHGVSFYTSPEFMDKYFIGESEYSDSNHFGEIIVTHSVQRERGKMQGVVVGDRSVIHHRDDLVSDKDRFNQSGIMINSKGEYLNSCGKPIVSKEKEWRMFNLNSPYSFLNNSPNQFYGIAIRKS